MGISKALLRVLLLCCGVRIWHNLRRKSYHSSYRLRDGLYFYNPSAKTIYTLIASEYKCFEYGKLSTVNMKYSISGGFKHNQFYFTVSHYNVTEISKRSKYMAIREKDTATECSIDIQILLKDH